MKLTKRECFDRARELVERGDAISLRYAALELRFCLEAITYEKLRASSSQLPASVIKKWQPPQAVKALLEYEPNADQGFALYVGIQEEYGKPSANMRFIGEHKTFKLEWLRKHYHKLGSLLHFPKATSDQVSQIADYLKEVLSDVQEVMSGTILGGPLGKTFNFECATCHDVVVCSKHRIETTHEVQCLNPACGSLYFAEITESSEAHFQLKVTEFSCGKCSSKIPVENRLLDIGYNFKCTSCGMDHRIMGRQWGYGTLSDTNED